MLITDLRDSGVHKVNYYHLTGTTFSLQQSIVSTTDVIDGIVLTESGQFLCLQNTGTHSLGYYEYDNISDSYIKVFDLTNFKSDPLNPIIS